MRADDGIHKRRLVLLGCLLALALSAIAVGAQAAQRGADSTSISKKKSLAKVGLGQAVTVPPAQRASSGIRECGNASPGSILNANARWRTVVAKYPQAAPLEKIWWGRKCHFTAQQLSNARIPQCGNASIYSLASIAVIWRAVVAKYPQAAPLEKIWWARKCHFRTQRPVDPPDIQQPADPPPTSGCTTTLASGANLSTAISNAAAGAVLCLQSGNYSANLSGVRKSSYVTVQRAAGQSPNLGHSLLNDSSYIRFRNLRFTDGAELIGATNHVQFLDNELTGHSGIRANGEDNSAGTAVTDVLIDGNNIHNLDYTGSQGTSGGYGVTAVNGVQRFTITDNTIKSVAADYLQSASPVDFTVDGNTFLGPTLVGSHPQEHQDLWQIFGGGTNITFSNNVARNTGTHESLLFQTGIFRNVVVRNNLFDHDSRGYTCQIYQSTGLVFRNNTIVGSHWGCLFRDDPGTQAGSGYQVDHNVFVGTEANDGVSTEGRAASWGTYDYNVSDDSSASGPHSVRNWRPSWASAISYLPAGLSNGAGYRVP